jgi:long-chain acyl-CoA synthetase
MTPFDAAAALGRAGSAILARKPWLVTEDRSLSFGDLAERARRLAGLFAERGVAMGDRVVIASRDDAEAALLLVGLIANGVTAILLDPDTPQARAEALIAKARPALVLADRALIAGWALADTAHPLIEIAPRSGRSGLIGSLLGKKATSEGLAAALEAATPRDPPAVIPPEILAYILFTSGTTREPKGVCISHGALFSHLATLTRLYGWNEDSRILNTLMLSHADGSVQGPLAAFVTGATVHRPARFEVGTIERLLDAVYQLRITHMIVVPTMLALFVRLAEAQRDAFQGGDFRMMGSCGGQLEADLWARAEALFGVQILNLYGLTETVSGGVVALPPTAPDKYGRIGRPVDCEARIVQETGELLLRGDLLMSGYFDEPGLTDEVLRDGWLHTGDLARCDADGDYWIIGRKKSVIIRGGLNVHPEEVAEVLNACPAVRDSIAFGLADKDWGEIVVALVAADKATAEVELLAWCAERLEPRKVPSRIRIVEDLPKGRSGKVMLEAARELFAVASGAPVATATSTEVEARVLAVAAQVFKTDPRRLSPASSPETVAGWDSLAHLELVAALEAEFSLSLSAREVLGLDTLSKAIQRVKAG